MAFPRLSASMLLASLILLYWTTSSAQSYDPASSVLSPSYRVKRDLAFEHREKVEKSFALANSVLTVVKEGVEKIDTKKLSNVIKGLATFASLAPGIGGLIGSFVNMVLIFIPQDDPVLIEVQKGFAEVNRKLDSISIQISNLATDVEWFNYASVYTQEEVRILNAWKRLNQLLKNFALVKREEDRLRLAKVFVNYYENTGTEASVANLYHYLTVEGTSLSGNLNELLKKKFKCNVHEIGKYNVYFSRLLWQGMVLNQFYWKLVNVASSGEHTQMFKTVYRAQISALEYCQNNHMHYVKGDVVEIRKGLSADNKKAIAVKVKNALDKKYNWYNWVVLVYNTKDAKNYILYDLTKITEDTITVAVGYILDTKEVKGAPVKRIANDCSKDKSCKTFKDKLRDCRYSWTHPYDDSVGYSYFTEIAKATHAAYGEDFAVAPAPAHQHDCLWRSHRTKISIYNSQRFPVCKSETCSHNGECKRLMDSNEWMCDCKEGYCGERCEKRTPNYPDTAVDIHVVPDIRTRDTEMIKVKLMEILNFINHTCRG